MKKHSTVNRPETKSAVSPAAQARPAPAAGRRQARDAARLRIITPQGRPAGRPLVAYRQRGHIGTEAESEFYAQELWYGPKCDGKLRLIVQSAGAGFVHPVTADEVRDRISLLPERFRTRLEVVQLSRMTRKRALFPAYGMQWGQSVYLYPIEASLVETYVRPPTPQQIIEARMFGGEWAQSGATWTLTWTESSLKDFYLNNVLIHEIGHVNDERNQNSAARERYANWFAIEYGYRASRGRLS